MTECGDLKTASSTVLVVVIDSDPWPDSVEVVKRLAFGTLWRRSGKLMKSPMPTDDGRWAFWAFSCN